MHLFIRELGKKFDSGSINAIAENKEKYISFNVSIVDDELEIFRSEEKIPRGKLIAKGKMKVAKGKKLVKGSEGKEEMIAKGKEMIVDRKKILAMGKRMIKIK